MAVDKQQKQYIFLESTNSTDDGYLDIDATNLITEHNDNGCNFVAFVDLMVHRSGNSNVQVTRYVARWNYYNASSILRNANDGANPATQYSIGTTQANITQPSPPDNSTLRLVLTPTSTVKMKHLVKVTLYVWDGAAA
jgi:hypothetical protein